MKQPTMIEDLNKYPKYKLVNGRLLPISEPFFEHGREWHHFLGRTIRKCQPARYKSLEHLQRMINIETNLHHSLENMSEIRVKSVTGLEKWQLIHMKNHNYEAEPWTT